MYYYNCKKLAREKFFAIKTLLSSLNITLHSHFKVQHLVSCLVFCSFTNNHFLILSTHCTYILTCSPVLISLHAS